MSHHVIDIPGTVRNYSSANTELRTSSSVPKLLQNTAVAESLEKIHDIKEAKDYIASEAAASSPVKQTEQSKAEPSNSRNFGITSEELSKLVNFDERNSKELVNLLKQYGGTCAIAKLLSVNLETGLVTKSKEVIAQAKMRKESKTAKKADSTFHPVTDGELRQKEFGFNFVEPPETESIFKMVLDTIKEDIIIKILLFGALVNFIIGIARQNEDGYIEGVTIMIAVIIVLSVTAGNDYSKDKKFKKLLLLQSDKKSKLLRDGKVDQTSSWEIVVGDIIELQPGDEVPADGLYVSGNRLSIDESPLTGETIPVKKTADSPFMFSGCQVGEGSGFMMVTAVGPKSSAGQIQALLNEKQTEMTALQQKMVVAAIELGKVGIGFSLVTFFGLTLRWGLNFALGTPWDPAQLDKLVDFFIVAVTVVVVAIPDGLPLAVTISLGFSMFRLIKENCFVRQLAAAETMGQATCICTDKTGTLTENRMAVVRVFAGGTVFSGEGSGDQNAKAFSDATFTKTFRDLLCESVCINSTCFIKYKPKDPLPVFVGSSTEGALLIMADKLGVKYEQLREKVVKVPNGELPFSSDRKRMATLVQPVAHVSVSGGKYRTYVKGASEIVLGLCTKTIDANCERVSPLSSSSVEEITQLIKKWASEGLRTLVIAYKDFQNMPVLDDETGYYKELDTDLVFMILVGIKDPIRKEVPQAVADCQRAGIVVRMVTGDNILTACSIAKECNIFDNTGIAMEGPVFRALSKEEKLKVIPRLQVLARSSPSDKYILVTLLREMGEVVAVTGDVSNYLILIL